MEEQKIYRSRQPVTQNGVTGYIDFWSKDLERAKCTHSQSPDRILESLTLSDIKNLTPGQQVKAMSAWQNAFD